MLTRTALELVNAVIVDPLSLDTSWDADKWLQFKVKLDSGQASEVLLGRGLEWNPVVPRMEARQGNRVLIFQLREPCLRYVGMAQGVVF